MLKKIVVGILALSVLGAAGAALAYAADKASTQVEAADVVLDNGQQTASQNTVNTTAQNTNQVNAQVAAQVAEGAQGDPYQTSGTIVAMDDYGMTVRFASGEEQYIELGPPDYWQSLGSSLGVGKIVFVDGTINDGMVHASTVILDDGQILTLRTIDGQPMWSGGVTNGQGQTSGAADGSHTPDPQAQVAPDEWVTLTGTLLSFQGGSMTIATDDGQVISFQTGQPRFLSAQGVTFQVGDQVSVVGFYEGTQFSAGEITQLSTGLRAMLRDPNGRPLWAGPGNGNGSGGTQN